VAALLYAVERKYSSHVTFKAGVKYLPMIVGDILANERQIRHTHDSCISLYHLKSHVTSQECSHTLAWITVIHATIVVGLRCNKTTTTMFVWLVADGWC
jgi:hypothetical protein